MKLCKRDACPRLLKRAYSLARGWMWVEPMQDLLRLEMKRVSGLKSEKTGYQTVLKSILEKAESLHRLIEQAAPSLEKRHGRTGFFVVRVDKGGGADAAGLLPGDVILSIGGKAVKHIEDYRRAATGPNRTARAVGDTKSPHSVFFLRGGLGHERSLRSLPIRAEVIALRKVTPHRR